MSTDLELCPKLNPTHHIPLVSAPPQVGFALPAPPAPTASPPRAVVPLGIRAAATATARVNQELSAEVGPAVATMR